VADFKKFDYDRFSQSLAQSINKPTGSLVTGDITRGDVVKVGPDFTDNSATAVVKARRAGAIMIGRDGSTDTHLHAWTIDGTILTVRQSNDADTTYWFWVF